MKAKKKTVAPLALPYIRVEQGGKEILLTAMSAAVLVHISYAAVRRESDEKGAVQRPLNEKRISKIRDFALAGGDFPACMILNWVKPKLLTTTSKQITIKMEPHSAQLIDGQHRVAGLQDAILTRKSLAAMQIPVAIYQNLSDQECADIFLSINTEQKPVPKSLAYDLFGIASSHVVDPAAVRAADIANFLHEDDESPYYGLVKYSTGGPKLGIALSTFVNAFKPLVAQKGVFEAFKVSDLKNQTKVILNYFSVLEGWYGEEWHTRNNAFMHAAGIAGSVDFLKTHLVPYCNSKKSYSSATMRAAMVLDPKRLIYKKEAERLGGRAMARTVKDLLVGKFIPANTQEDDIEFDD